MNKFRPLLVFAVLAACVSPLAAYVGPGAGFAFVGSFFFIFVAFFVALFNFLTFPVRILFRLIKRLRYMKNARFKRVIIVGFDGMDYRLFNTFKSQGEPFPNFSKLSENGSFRPLFSTEPPISPVAWSTFATGVNPGKHNIFDFLTSDRKNYMPKLSGTDTIPPKRYLNFGRWQIPLSKPRLELMRKSKSFWKIVSDRGIFSSVLRVPYTYPPEKLYGMMLAGLGTPDLRGTQGSFSFYSEKEAVTFDIWEGTAEELKKTGGNRFEGILKGPGSPFVKGNPPLTVPFSVTVEKVSTEAVFRINRQDYRLQPNRLSEWIKVEFKVGFIKIRGIIQLVLKGLDPLSLYISPINIDPENPTMPISHPKIFSAYLAKSTGSFATLGMAEDTTAVNEGVLSEEAFLQQVYLAQAERERIFFDTFKKQKNGLIVQVFETTDRVQHMFWKQMTEGSSATEPSTDDASKRDAIRESYRRMDDFLGRLLPLTGEKDLVMVVSDHGFNAFNREFHLNSWLHQQGYLVLKEGKNTSGKFFADVDWTRTRAYGQGLNGLYLNLKGRENNGVVQPGKEAETLKTELKSRLQTVIDDSTGEKPIDTVFKREEIYRGPYLSNAPDLQIGYNIGYRVSWESTVNYVGDVIFSDNSRAWSGDHAFTRDRIPGIFFANKMVREKKPTLLDISPTVLAAFGLQKPSFVDGSDLEVGQVENGQLQNSQQ